MDGELGVEEITARLIFILVCDCRVAALILLHPGSCDKLDVVQGVPFQAGSFLACIELEEELNDSLKVVGPEKLVRVATVTWTLELICLLSYILEEELVGEQIWFTIEGAFLRTITHLSKNLPSLLVLVQPEELVELLIERRLSCGLNEASTGEANMLGAGRTSHRWLESQSEHGIVIALRRSCKVWASLLHSSEKLLNKRSTESSLLGGALTQADTIARRCHDHGSLQGVLKKFLASLQLDIASFDLSYVE